MTNVHDINALGASFPENSRSRYQPMKILIRVYEFSMSKYSEMKIYELHKHLAKSVAILGIVAHSSSCYAMVIPHGVPGKAESSFEYMNKLYGYGWTIVAEDGKAEAHALFSNSRKWEGSYTVSMNVRVMAGNDLLFGYKFVQELGDPAFHGGTIERGMKVDFALTPDQWASVTEIRYDYGTVPTVAECSYWLQKAMENPNIYFNPSALGCSS